MHDHCERMSVFIEQVLHASVWSFNTRTDIAYGSDNRCFRLEEIKQQLSLFNEGHGHISPLQPSWRLNAYSQYHLFKPQYFESYNTHSSCWVFILFRSDSGGRTVCFIFRCSQGGQIVLVETKCNGNFFRSSKLNKKKKKKKIIAHELKTGRTDEHLSPSRPTLPSGTCFCVQHFLPRFLYISNKRFPEMLL